MTFIGEKRQAEGELAPGPPTGFGDVYQAAVDHARYVDNGTAREKALEEAFDARSDAVFAATGQRLANPLRAGPGPDYFDFRARQLTESDRHHLDDLDPMRAYRQELMRRFDADLQRIATERPDKAEAIRAHVPVIEDARQKARDAEKAFDDAQSRYGGPWGGGTAASFIGGFRGMLEDPMNVVALFAGPTSRAAAGLKGMLWMGVKQGAANAGVEALQQPELAAWRKEAGLGYTSGDFLRNVGTAAAFGFGMDAGVRGLARGYHGLRGHVPVLDEAGGVKGWQTPEQALEAAALKSKSDLLRAAAGGDEKALRSLAEQTGIAEDPAVRSALEHLDVMKETEGARPLGVDMHEHDDWTEQLGRALMDPEEPLPRMPDPVPEATGQSLADHVPLEVPKEPGAGAHAITYGGKPIQIERTPEHGGGRALVFEDASGRRIPVDAPPWDVGETLVFRAADGWTPDAADLIARRRRLQNGHGDAVDAAQVMRAYPDAVDTSVSLATAEMRTARALARLTDAAFDRVVAGDAHPRLAALVADHVPAERQADILDRLVKLGPRTPDEARRIIGGLLDPPPRRARSGGIDDPNGPEAETQVKALRAGLAGVRRTTIAHPDYPDIRMPLNADGSVTLYRGSRRGDGAGRMFTLDVDAARRYATLDGRVDVVHVGEDVAHLMEPRLDGNGRRVPGQFALPDEIAASAVPLPSEIERRIEVGASRAVAAEAVAKVKGDIPDMSAVKVLPAARSFEPATVKILDAVRKGGLPAVEAELAAMDRATARDAAARLAGAHLASWETLPDRYRAPLLAAGAIRRWAYAAEPGDLRARLLAAADDLDGMARVPQDRVPPPEPPAIPTFVEHPGFPDLIKLKLRDDGTVRLYRGERPDRPARGAFGQRLFTTDIERALRNVRETGGILRTVDVPRERLAELDPRRSGDRREVKAGTDVFTVPDDVARAAKPVDGEALELLDAATRAAAPAKRAARPEAAGQNALERLANAVDEGSLSHRQIVSLAQKAEAEAIAAAPDIEVRRGLDNVSALMRLKELLEACKDG